MSETALKMDTIRQFLLQQREIWGAENLLLGVEQCEPEANLAADAARIQQIPVVESKEMPASRIKIAPQMNKRQLLQNLRDRLTGYNANSVFGIGTANANTLFLSQDVTSDNVQKNKVFPADVEAIFLRMLKKMGFTPNEIFLTPLFKFADSAKDENDKNLALKIIHEQIKIIQPRYLIVLGEAAARALIDPSMEMDQLRSKIHHIDGLKAVVTHCPSMLVENKQLFWQVFDDMKLFRTLFDREIGGKPPMQD